MCSTINVDGITVPKSAKEHVSKVCSILYVNYYSHVKSEKLDSDFSDHSLYIHMLFWTSCRDLWPRYLLFNNEVFGRLSVTSFVLHLPIAGQQSEKGVGSPAVV